MELEMASARTEFKSPPAEGLTYDVINVDDKYYDLDESDFQFWSSQTGLADPAALKEHILTVQKEAYAVRTHPGSSIPAQQ